MHKHGLERNLPVVLQGKMQDSHVVQQEVWENVEPCLKKKIKCYPQFLMCSKVENKCG